MEVRWHLASHRPVGMEAYRLMRIRELYENPELLDAWELFDHYDLDHDDKHNMDDVTLGWINRNKPGCISSGIRKREWRQMSHIMFWMKNIKGLDNWGVEFATPEEFEAALDSPITLWRAGGGVYDSDFANPRSWVSFTPDQRRIETFFKYDATYASRAYRLPERRGAAWVVELNCKLKDILLYLPHGQDDEVIISKKLAATARVIRTKD